MKIEPLLVEKPWGGPWLAQKYRARRDAAIGEAWLLSTLPEGESLADGRKISSTFGALPFVVKVIDAADHLSVQVHPNDEWAARLENSRGKTECWLILDSKPGAGVYLGLRDGVAPADFERELRAGHAVDHLIQFHSVKRGDFITVPAGTVHAIGAGVTLLEVQQASGITYRLWDWGRPGRELHLDKGLQVASYDRRFEVRHDVLSTSGVLLKHADFECRVNSSEGEGWFIDLESLDVYRDSKPHGESQFVWVR